MPMDALVIDATAARSGLAPFSLKDAPALIERVFPAQKVGVEAQKERKAGTGQTLTALGSYWKGRKPLVLVRACLLGSLLPATNDPEADLALFEALMRMDTQGLLRRHPEVTAGHVWLCTAIVASEKSDHIEPPKGVEHNEARAEDEDTVASSRCGAAKWRRIDISQTFSPKERKAERDRIEEEREAMRNIAFNSMSFTQQVAICKRVEKVETLQEPNDPLYAGIWTTVNARLGTTAFSVPELVEELGIARFGRRPIIGDPFCGGGSIPFEAARIGCDVVASDLNPVAAMLTWGALNIIGADKATREEIATEQRRVASAVDAEITRLGIEHNSRGDRAKAFLSCMEVVDPATGWRVPMSPTWIISRNRRCIARLKPDYAMKRFDIAIEESVSLSELKEAEAGTVRDSHLIYRLAPKLGGSECEWRTPISRLRGDGERPKTVGAGSSNLLRQWTISDVAPREPEWSSRAKPVLAGASPGAWLGGDVWLERLYAIQWMDGNDISDGRTRPRTFFAAPDEADLAREAEIQRMVENNLAEWQAKGLLPDMAIEHGYNTTQPIRERGWSHWHHFFTPRQLLLCATIRRQSSEACAFANFPRLLDFSSKLCRWINSGREGGGADFITNGFSNQALNPIVNPAARGLVALVDQFEIEWRSPSPIAPTARLVEARSVSESIIAADLWIYDPPYADAVHYHEITEFFIAWLRKAAPAPFDTWTWDSRRPMAVQGKGEKFRIDMVKALLTMSRNMPNNGLQICMFTHQDAGVWADMAQIVWGAGLRVTAAWYVSTETTSEQKKGGYVQGTVLMVLRKRKGDERGYRDEIVLEVRGAVKRQVELLTGLNQRANDRQRDENPFSDADIQMAGYAAALEVLTGYTHIEGMDMTREALRPRVKGQTGIVEDMIALAVQTATELMRPEGIEEGLWERLVPTERFWLKMTEAEADRPIGQPCGKLDDYQNFAKAYRADGWDDLMADRTPNKARLKGAAEFKRAMMAGHPFSGGVVRPVLYAISELRSAAEKEEDAQTSGDRAIGGLRDNLASWGQQRLQANAIAEWLGRTLTRHRPEEATAARVLATLIRTERLG